MLKKEYGFLVTPEEVRSLEKDQVFVFGSNLAGKHGRGAAHIALKWGAEFGNPEGIQGQTYAIPTKTATVLKALDYDEIEFYIERFDKYARKNPDKTFLVTKIGCGLAGLDIEKMAYIFFCFEDCSLYNVAYPIEFIEYFKKFDDENDRQGL
jgi:hypothetical protein